MTIEQLQKDMIAAMSAVTLLVQKRNEKNSVKHKTTV